MWFHQAFILARLPASVSCGSRFGRCVTVSPDAEPEAAQPNPTLFGEHRCLSPALRASGWGLRQTKKDKWCGGVLGFGHSRGWQGHGDRTGVWSAGLTASAPTFLVLPDPRSPFPDTALPAVPITWFVAKMKTAEESRRWCPGDVCVSLRLSGGQVLQLSWNCGGKKK